FSRDWSSDVCSSDLKNADRINVGVSGTADLPAWSGTGPGVPFSFSVAVSTPTKVYRVTIPSFIAPFLVFSSVKIGPTELIDGNRSEERRVGSGWRAG